MTAPTWSEDARVKEARGGYEMVVEVDGLTDIPYEVQCIACGGTGEVPAPDTPAEETK